MRKNVLVVDRFEQMKAQQGPQSSTSHSCRIGLLTTEAAVDSLRSEWDHLLEDSDQGVFFLRWHWNRTWWRMFAPTGSSLFILTCRDESGRLVGLAPFYLQERRHLRSLRLRELSFLGTGTDIRTSEYLDIVARRGYEQPVAKAIATFLVNSRDWDRLWLWHIPSDSVMLRHFSDALGTAVQVTPCDRAYYVDTRRNWEAVSGGLGQNLNRLFQQVAQEKDCRFSHVLSLDELEPALGDLVSLHQARWQSRGQTGSFAVPRVLDFVRETAHDSVLHGRLGLWRLSINGRCIAALLAFIDFETAHYFQSGFDPTPSYQSYSLGRTLVGLCLRDCVQADGIGRFDLMGGEGTYKQTWTSSVREISQLELLQPGVRSSVYRGARRSTAFLSRVYRSYRAAVNPQRPKAGHRERSHEP